MKFGELKSIGHNIADSLASGICLLIGYYEIEIYSEAVRTPEGSITVNFLDGTSTGGKPSSGLAEAIQLYSGALVDLCKRHGIDASAFKTLIAEYAVDAVYGGHFTVTVEDQNGRRSTDRYVGMPGRRVRTRR